MRVVKDRGNQNLGLNNKVERQYKDRESIKDNTLFSFSNIYDCYKYIKDNIPGFADLFYSEKYDFNISRSIKIIQIVCRANASIGIGIVQDPCEENDRLYICSGNNDRQMFEYMSKHCPETVIEIENTGMLSVANYYYGNIDDDCHSISSNLLDVLISYLKKVSSKKYPEYLRAPESMFSGVLESAKKETKLIKESCCQKVNALEWLEALKESSALGLSKKVKKKFGKVDIIDNVSVIPFKDPEVEHICNEHDVYTVDDAARVSSIKEWFSNNDKIKSFDELKFFTGLETIEVQAFSFCTSLQSVTIPKSVTSIGYRAFENCSSLQSIHIPNSVTSIGYSAFWRCESLKKVYMSSSCKAFTRIMAEVRKSSKDVIIIDPNNQKLLKRAGLVESVVRENKETNITNSQGQDVPELGKHAENVYLPDCPFMIGKDQVDWFEYFQREKEKHTIKDVDDFVQSAKKETKLIKESCGSKRVNALEWFMALQENTSLGLAGKSKKKFDKADAVVNVSQIPFEDPEVEHICHEHGVYTVDDAAKVTSIKGIIKSWFKENETIKSFNELKFFTGLKTIEDQAFSYCTSLQSVTIPKSVTSTEDYAFAACESLQSVTIPDSITNIGYASFYRCTSLQSINIPNSVTSIGELAFYECTSLQSVTIPSSVTSIEGSTFSHCESLQSVTIPNSVTSIGEYAFYVCSSLQSVTIPNSVTSIGELAFYECTSLQSVVIPDSVTSIGERAFMYCESLQSIYISKNCPVYNQIRKAYPDIRLIEPKVNETSNLGLNSKVKKNYERTHGQDIDLNQLADFIRSKVYVAAGYSPDEDETKVDYNLRVRVKNNCLMTGEVKICDEACFYYAIQSINFNIEGEENFISNCKNNYIPRYKNNGDKTLEASALEAIENSNRHISGLVTLKNELESIGWYGILKAMTNSRD